MSVWKRRNPNWKLAMLLLAGSIVVGYPCAQSVGASMWGGSHSPLALIGFFASLVAFVAAILIFISIAGAAVVSSPEPPASSSVRPAWVKLGEEDPSGHAAVQRGENRGPIFVLQFLVLIIIASNFWEVVSDTGGPAHYGSLFWYCVANQIPLLVALWRMRKGPDGIGLVLLLAASIGQILFVLAFGHDYIEGWRNPWKQLAALLNSAAIGYGVWIWQRFRTRLPEVGVVLSIFIGLAAYTFASHALLHMLLRQLEIQRMHLGR
jgi:hypothetical protein